MNATPDSFYSGSRIQTVEDGIKKAGEMWKAGADILDIGGQSTRPGSMRIPAQEEAGRVIPLIREISGRFPELILSVDTYHAKVADEAIQAGAGIVNDISAGELDPEILHVVARHQVPYVLMHMQGTPETMQDSPTYTDIMSELTYFFSDRIQRLRDLGIQDIILDPGFGFGKRFEDNFTLLAHLKEFTMFGCPLLAGLSRKRMISEATGKKSADNLHGTLAAQTLALASGASILRTHDVEAASDMVKVVIAARQSVPEAAKRKRAV